MITLGRRAGSGEIERFTDYGQFELFPTSVIVESITPPSGNRMRSERYVHQPEKWLQVLKFKGHGFIWEEETSVAPMKRPFPVTFLGGLFVVVGLTNLLYHVVRSPLDLWLVPISLLSILAIVAGIFLIKGRAWARWLALAWLAVHVVASAFHSFSDSAAHLFLLVAVGYFLLGQPGSSYFTSPQTK